MISQTSPRAFDEASATRADNRSAGLSVSRVVATLQVVLATRRAARAAERAARNRADS
jgi:hypothetical protein